MTDQELLTIAEALATQRARVENLGMMNRPTDIEKRIKVDAEYMIESDKLLILDQRYRAALRERYVV